MTQSTGRGTCAWLKDLQFTDGTVECDMAGGAYLGISFRVIQDDESGDRLSEDVYFRVEGNERSGTVQYYPHGKMNQEQLHRPPYERSIRLINQKDVETNTSASHHQRQSSICNKWFIGFV